VRTVMHCATRGIGLTTVKIATVIQ
jgi:hypothetical protein